jgi:hypothetical protein
MTKLECNIFSIDQYINEISATIVHRTCSIRLNRNLRILKVYFTVYRNRVVNKTLNCCCLVYSFRCRWGRWERRPSSSARRPASPTTGTELPPLAASPLNVHLPFKGIISREEYFLKTYKISSLASNDGLKMFCRHVLNKAITTFLLVPI